MIKKVTQVAEDRQYTFMLPSECIEPKNLKKVFVNGNEVKFKVDSFSIRNNDLLIYGGEEIKIEYEVE